MKMTLSTDSAERKNYPLLSGALRYAPAAFALMAKTSKLGNDKHNPGQELHHARGKSPDHGDCVIRHMVDVQDIVAAIDRMHKRAEVNPGDRDLGPALETELGQLQWRVSLYVQEMAEKYLGAPLAPGARLPVPEKVIEPLYVIVTSLGSYWKAPGSGLTRDLSEAHLYTSSQADEHIAARSGSIFKRLAP